MSPVNPHDDDLARIREAEEDHEAAQAAADREADKADYGFAGPPCSTCGHPKRDHKSVRTPKQTLTGTCWVCSCKQFTTSTAGTPPRPANDSGVASGGVAAPLSSSRPSREQRQERAVRASITPRTGNVAVRPSTPTSNDASAAATANAS